MASATTSVLSASYLAHAEPAAPKVVPQPVPRAAATEDLDAFAHKPPRSPDDKIAFELDDADLSELVRVVGEITGKRFVVASPKLAKVKASVYAPQKVTAAEAYQAFLAVLAANGLTIIPQAGFYKIVESQDIARQLTPIERGDLPAEERYVTRIQHLSHLSAEEVATDVLSKLATKDASIVPYAPSNVLIITETAANLRRMLEILAAIDAAGDEDKLWLRPLKYVGAAQVQKEVEASLDLKKTADAAAGPLHVARVVAVDRPNALVVVATRASYERLAALVDELDVAPSNETQVRVVMLQHSEAKKIVAPINDALGSGAATRTQGGGGGAAAASPGVAQGVLEGPVKVAADETTNALIVTATPRDFQQIKGVIDALDQPKRQVFLEAAVLDISIEHDLNVAAAFHGGDQSSALLGKGTQTSFAGFRPVTSVMPGQGDLQGFVLGAQGPAIPFTGIPGISEIPGFGALLSAIAISTGADVMLTPSVITSDNLPTLLRDEVQTSLQPNAPQTALISGLAAAGNPLSTAALSGGSVPNVSGAVRGNYQPIGPRINVTPHLNDSDEVRLDIDELISDIQNPADPDKTFSTITYVEREAKTTLTIKDGQTVVLAGLMRDKKTRQESKVPFLGDIPLLGVLFRTSSETKLKSNIVLILTPHIIRSPEDLRRIGERKIEEHMQLQDHAAIFDRTSSWEPPRDWHHARGLVAAVRSDQRDVAVRLQEASAIVGPAETKTPPPLDLPTPQGNATAKPTAPAAATKRSPTPEN